LLRRLPARLDKILQVSLRNVSIKYDNAVRGCFIHTLFLTVSIWLWWWGAWKFSIQLPSGIVNAMWFVSLCAWPLWAVFLWMVAEGKLWLKLWRVASPLLSCCIVLAPSFFPAVLIYGFNHAKHF